MPQKPEFLGHAATSVDTLIDAWSGLLNILGGPPTTTNEATNPALSTSDQQIPVTILSGFLGAGKTTLLCSLLETTDLNIVAIVNDLAAVNIDAALVRSTSAQTIQLENGCACCVLGNDLSDVFAEIGQRDIRPDAIVIEASGVSDPMGIAQTIAFDPTTVLDGIVCMVDAETIHARLQDPGAAPLLTRQLNAAHLTLVSKARDAEHLASVQQSIGKLAPGRPALAVDQIEGQLERLILGAKMHGARPEPESASHSYDGFAHSVIAMPRPIKGEAFFNLMECIPDSVYRIKGWVTVQEDQTPSRQEFQSVGSRWRSCKAEQTSSSDELIVIGRASESTFDEFVATLAHIGSA